MVMRKNNREKRLILHWGFNGHLYLSTNRTDPGRYKHKKIFEYFELSFLKKYSMLSCGCLFLYIILDINIPEKVIKKLEGP